MVHKYYGSWLAACQIVTTTSGAAMQARRLRRVAVIDQRLIFAVPGTIASAASLPPSAAASERRFPSAVRLFEGDSFMTDQLVIGLAGDKYGYRSPTRVTATALPLARWPKRRFSMSDTVSF